MNLDKLSSTGQYLIAEFNQFGINLTTDPFDQLSKTGNYLVTKFNQLAEKIAKNPSAVRRVLQITLKVFAGVDLKNTGEIRDVKERDITSFMDGSIKLIDFYDFYRTIVYWINPFTKETLDEKALSTSLETILCDPIQNKRELDANKAKAKNVFDEVMKKRAILARVKSLKRLKRV